MPIVNSNISSTTLYHDLKGMDRDNFSYDGAKALMDYFEQLSDEIGGNIEYDPIGFCCEFSEYGDLDDFNNCYDSDNPFESWEEVAENTIVIEFNSGVIVQDF